MAYRGIIGTTDGKDRRETDSDSFDDSMGGPGNEHSTTKTPSRHIRISDHGDTVQPKTKPAKPPRLNCKCDHIVGSLPLSLSSKKNINKNTCGSPVYNTALQAKCSVRDGNPKISIVCD